MIDKIYLLNLDYHKDRLKRIEKQYKYLPIKPTRISAIDGNKMLNLSDKMDIEEKWIEIKNLNQKLIQQNKICNNSKWTFKPGQIGHYFSFYKIFQDAFKHNYQYILILEDDINIKSSFINQFNNALKTIPKNWDLIYFSLHQIHQQFNGVIKKINSHWGIPIGIKTNNKFNHMLPGTHAILYSKNAIKIILDNYLPMCYPTDNFISILIKDNKLKPLYLYGDLITTYHAPSSTEFIGGGNYQIIKELGKGYKGIAWLIKQNNQLLVLKRQKILPNELNKDSPIRRELNFFNFIKTLPIEEQKYFSKMIYFKTFTCKDFNNYTSDDDRRTKSNLCVDIVMTYQGDTVMNLILSNSLNSIQFKEFLKTIINIIKILKKNGYSHDDLSYNNISYLKINNQYHYSLIDYGTTFNI
jgi:GR25 family glycosyltransferase involved in LPS biosynthesis